MVNRFAFEFFVTQAAPFRALSSFGVSFIPCLRFSVVAALLPSFLQSLVGSSCLCFHFKCLNSFCVIYNRREGVLVTGEIFEVHFVDLELGV